MIILIVSWVSRLQILYDWGQVSKLTLRSLSLKLRMAATHRREVSRNLFCYVRERGGVAVQSFASCEQGANEKMETARTWNGPDWLVDISKYLLSAPPVLLPVSSPSYGLNLASIPFKALSFLKSFQAFRDISIRWIRPFACMESDALEIALV